MLQEELDDELFWGKEDWDVGDDSLACVLNLIGKDEYDTVKELENQFDSVWINVRCFICLELYSAYFLVLFIMAHLCAG